MRVCETGNGQIWKAHFSRMGSPEDGRGIPKTDKSTPGKIQRQHEAIAAAAANINPDPTG